MTKEIHSRKLIKLPLHNTAWFILVIVRIKSKYSWLSLDLHYKVNLFKESIVNLTCTVLTVSTVWKLKIESRQMLKHTHTQACAYKWNN